eukprot:Lankesteria_metandrocarpae@DN10337_c0_g1_i2.p2
MVIVSIIIPLKNAEKFIGDTLEGIASQTVVTEEDPVEKVVVEVVVFDDCSSDGSVGIVEGFQQRLSALGVHLVLLRNKTGVSLGCGGSRNKAVYSSRGEYLCFNDADDISLPTRIEKQLAAARSKRNCIVGSKFRRLPEGSTARYASWLNGLTNDQLKTQKYRECTLAMPTWFMARDVFNKQTGFKEALPAWLTTAVLKNTDLHTQRKRTMYTSSIMKGSKPLKAARRRLTNDLTRQGTVATQVDSSNPLLCGDEEDTAATADGDAGGASADGASAGGASAGDKLIIAIKSPTDSAQELNANACGADPSRQWKPPRYQKLFQDTGAHTNAVAEFDTQDIPQHTDMSKVPVPEDLLFFYDHLDTGGCLYKVEEELVVYRYHEGNLSFEVPWQVIHAARVRAIEKDVLCNWTSFGIWGAGKEGKRFFKSLSLSSQARVDAFYDIDQKKLACGAYQDFENCRDIPVIHFAELKPPFVTCVKLMFTGGEFEANLASFNLVEGRDYYLFS